CPGNKTWAGVFAPAQQVQPVAPANLARIKELYTKLATSPLGMAEPWARKASNGKPLLYGGRRGLLAYGTIATWDEFDLIAEIVNSLPQLLPSEKSAHISDDRPHGEVLDEMDHQAKYQPATIDTRREQELRIQALGAALSRRDWPATERAY